MVGRSRRRTRAVCRQRIGSRGLRPNRHQQQDLLGAYASSHRASSDRSNFDTPTMSNRGSGIRTLGTRQHALSSRQCEGQARRGCSARGPGHQRGMHLGDAGRRLRPLRSSWVALATSDVFLISAHVLAKSGRGLSGRTVPRPLRRFAPRQQRTLSSLFAAWTR